MMNFHFYFSLNRFLKYNDNNYNWLLFKVPDNVLGVGKKSGLSLDLAFVK